MADGLRQGELASGLYFQTDYTYNMRYFLYHMKLKAMGVQYILYANIFAMLRVLIKPCWCKGLLYECNQFREKPNKKR